jgi:adenosylcobinamide-GDP ribazoletransferase
MKKELRIFLAALMFFTRIPVPSTIHHGQDLLGRSPKYFPWIGLIVGCVAAGAYLLTAMMFSPAIAVFVSMLTSILLTGAFHEDGFADVCDGFGGGWTKEKILLIMKDSRLGTYGVIGLISMLPFKFMLLLEIANVPALIICGHTISRFAAVTMIQELEYVTDASQSKSKPVASRKLPVTEMMVAIAGAFLPFIFISIKLLPALILVLAARLYLGYYFKKWIGGYTGDCLGAVQQVCEVFFYLGILVSWKFI